MKHLFPLLFILMGCLFLLISLIFFPSITQVLIDLQGEMNLTTPSFWDTSTVLKIVRIIFIIVGVFLTVFGIAFYWAKRR